MQRENSGRCDPSWNQPVHTCPDECDTTSLRRVNSELIGKLFSLKWTVTELSREKAELRHLLSSLNHRRSFMKADLERVRTERDALLADLERVRTERDTLLAAGRASNAIMQRKRKLSSCFMSPPEGVHEPCVSKSTFASVIAMADKNHTTPTSFPWDGFYKLGSEQDPASAYPSPSLAEEEEESSPAPSNPCAGLTAEEKDKIKRRLLTQRGPITGSRLAVDEGRLVPATPDPSTSGLSPVSAQPDSRCAGLLQEAKIPADSPENDPEAHTSPLTSGDSNKVCEISNSGTETDCLDEGAQAGNDGPVHSSGDCELSSHELEEGAETEADDPGPTQPNQQDQGDDAGPRSTEVNETEKDCVEDYDTEQDQPMATSPTQRKGQPPRVDSPRSGKPESESSRTLSDCPAAVVPLPTSSAGVSLKIEVPYPNDARQGSAHDDPIGPVPHACLSGNTIADRMRSSLSDFVRGQNSSDIAQSYARQGSAPDDPIGPVPHARSIGNNTIADRMRSSLSDFVRGQKSSDIAQSSIHGLSAKRSPDTDARAPRTFERDMTGQLSKVHGPGSYKRDGKEAWDSDLSRMDERKHGSRNHVTERFTHVTYCCWCINQSLQSKAVALCGRCPRVMCSRCASGWGLAIPTGQRSRDILLPYQYCRCTRRDSHFPKPHQDCQLEAYLLEHLMKHDLSLQFRKPVDLRANPNYLSIITHDKMMDLSTMALKMEKRHYMTARGQRLFQRHLQQVWINCWKYAGYDPDSDAPVPGIVSCTLILVKMVNNFYESHMQIPMLTFDDECWLAVKERIKHGMFSQIGQGQVDENPRLATVSKPADGTTHAARDGMEDSEENEWQDIPGERGTRCPVEKLPAGCKGKVSSFKVGKILPVDGSGDGGLNQLAEIGAKLARVRRVSRLDSRAHGLR